MTTDQCITTSEKFGGKNYNSWYINPHILQIISFFSQDSDYDSYFLDV